MPYTQCLSNWAIIKVCEAFMLRAKIPRCQTMRQNTTQKIIKFVHYCIIPHLLTPYRCASTRTVLFSQAEKIICFLGCFLLVKRGRWNRVIMLWNDEGSKKRKQCTHTTTENNHLILWAWTKRNIMVFHHGT